MQKILVMSQSFEDEQAALDLLEASGFAFDVIRMDARRDWNEEDLMKAMQGYTALIAGGDFKITRKMVASSSKLEAVSLNCTGIDHVDTSALKDRGIALFNTPGLSHTAVADFIIGQILSLMRNLVAGDRNVRAGKWDKGVEKGLSVTGKTLGIIGLGSIGLDVCKRAKGFEMRVLANVRNPKPELAKEHGFTYLSREEVLRQSDILVITCPLTEETRGMIGKNELAMMKKDAVLINSARGPIVDEEALYVALKSGALYGAALDVFSTEPLLKSRFFELDNVVLTPHLAGRADRQIEDCAVKAVENLMAYYRDEQPYSRLL